MSHKIVQECRCCRARSFERVLSLGDLPIGDNFRAQPGEAGYVCPQELWVCRGCGLITLSHVVDPAVLYQDQSYFYQTSISPGLSAHFLDVASHLTRCTGISAGDPVVDIGCNDGTLLKAFQSLGHRNLRGFEPTPRLALVARESGIEVENAFFSSRTTLPRPAMLVTANNVFANIDDLDGFLEGIGRSLDLRGTLVIETGYGIDLIQNAVLDNVYHEHLSYFTLSSLQAVFGRHGMEIWNAERVHTKGGSLRCFAQMRGGPHPIDRGFLELRILEDELGFDTLLPFRAFETHLSSIRSRLQDWIARRDGSPIAGFGASVGTVTMLEYFGLHGIVNVLYDDNPIKFGTHSPLQNIPVRSSDRLAADAPDIVAILPWRYRHRIQARHASALPDSSRFLSILPEPALHGTNRIAEILP